MIDDVPCFRGKPNTLHLACKVTPRSAPPQGHGQPGTPALSRPRESFRRQDESHLGKRAIVQREGLLAQVAVQELRGVGPLSPPSPPGRPFWRGTSFGETALPGWCRRNLAGCTQQRKLYPPRQRGGQPSDTLPGFQHKHHQKPAMLSC